MTYTHEEALEASVQYFEGDELAATVFVTKYALRTEDGELLEKTPIDMHRRLAREFARIEAKYPNPMNEDEIFALLDKFKYIVPQGSPMSAIGNPNQVQSISNCFVIDPPRDSYGSIARADENVLQIQKRRGGVGIDISNIRPRTVKVKNAAGSSDGIGIFMERYSNTTREVAQNGRRGALMITIDGRHPDVETFINTKRDRTKVTGANVSVRVTDDFMKAVENDEQYMLRWPVTVEVAAAGFTKTILARELWQQMMHAAWECAEPGILYWDTVKRLSMADEFADKGFETICTNPCFIGSTLVAVADGRNAVSLEQLTNEGLDVPVYSTNLETDQVEIKMGRFPRKTGTNRDVYRVTLDDGSSFVATPEHLVLLKNRTYKKVIDLEKNDALFPFNSFNNNGYRQVCNTGAPMIGGARRNRRQYRLIHEFYSGEIVDAKQYAIHHVDYNSHNDSYSNLEVMNHEAHHALHSQRMRGDNNPARRMMTDAWRNNVSIATKGSNNPRYFDISNDELIEHGKKLFAIEGRITKRTWYRYAASRGLPKVLSHPFRFGSWSNFHNQVAENHKVINVTYEGCVDVYDLTVDDNSNFHIITSWDDDKYITSSGVCVHNCAELPLSRADSCRLLLLNLASYVNEPYTPTAKFDYALFAEHVIKAQRLMDDLVDLEIEAIDRILAKVESDPEPTSEKIRELALWKDIREACANGRRTGTGITALGDMLAALGQTYGSTDSIEITETVYRMLALNAHASSVIMARERGAFPAWESGRYADNEFAKQLAVASDSTIHEWFVKYGRRNIALTTTAPAGSVSTLTQTTSGIEPAYLLHYKRRKKLRDNEIDNGARVDHVDALGDKWQEYDVYHHGLKKWMEVSGETDIEKSPYHKATSNDVDWVASVDLLAVAQKWTEHSISKTINLPKHASVELVSEVYMRAWKLGIKGVTVYRDGCRDGVLIAADAKKEDKKEDKIITDRHAPRRPKVLECDIQRTTVKGEKYMVLVGLLEGRPYELFCGLSDKLEVPKRFEKGRLHKNGKNKDGLSTYNLHIDLGDDEFVVKDVATMFDNATHSSFTRMVSLSLRHGVPVQFVCEQMSKSLDEDMQSFAKVLSRVLKRYIPDGTKPASDKTCLSCGSPNVSYQEGCLVCLACGSSKCG
jgi:ribonucleotide reductase alpha subunit